MSKALERELVLHFHGYYKEMLVFSGVIWAIFKFSKDKEKSVFSCILTVTT